MSLRSQQSNQLSKSHFKNGLYVYLTTKFLQHYAQQHLDRLSTKPSLTPQEQANHADCGKAIRVHRQTLTLPRFSSLFPAFNQSPIMGELFNRLLRSVHATKVYMSEKGEQLQNGFDIENFIRGEVKPFTKANTNKPVATALYKSVSGLQQSAGVANSLVSLFSNDVLLAKLLSLRVVESPAKQF